MQNSGYKTRAVFDRYNIVEEGDIGSARGTTGAVFQTAESGSGGKAKDK
jgi:hypothetical protein